MNKLENLVCEECGKSSPTIKRDEEGRYLCHHCRTHRGWVKKETRVWGLMAKEMLM